MNFKPLYSTLARLCLFVSTWVTDPIDKWLIETGRHLLKKAGLTTSTNGEGRP